MLSDVSASWLSPKAALATSAAAERLRLSLQAGPICLIPRTLPDKVADALDRMEPESLPTFDVSGHRDRVRKAVVSAIASDAEADAPVVRWLRDDILGLINLFVRATPAKAVRTRLHVVRDDMCRAFHVDQVAYRLLTTYRGPGTQWIPPRLLATAAPNRPLDSDQVRSLDRGTVAILRGARGATPDRPGVPHRSPPIAGSGQVRLILAINEAVA